MSSLMMIFMQTPGILERQIFRPGAGNAPAAATCILNTCIVSSIIEHAYIYTYMFPSDLYFGSSSTLSSVDNGYDLSPL